MWLLTTIGFFSVVAYTDDPNVLLVRARVREDLEALRDQHLPDLEILETVAADYRFRAVVTRKAFARVAGALVASIDYPNFKDVVKQRQGQARASAYSDVWSVLYRLQTDERIRS
jgi:hypothetical protein